MATTNTQILEKLNEMKDKLQVEDNKVEFDRLEENEKKFRKRVDSLFTMTSVGLSTIIAVAPFFCPELALAAGILLAVASAIHYYDKVNNYELSHWFANLPKRFTTQENNPPNEVHQKRGANRTEIDKPKQLQKNTISNKFYSILTRNNNIAIGSHRNSFFNTAWQAATPSQKLNSLYTNAYPLLKVFKRGRI